MWVRPESGLMRLIRSDSYAGLLVRRLLMAAVIVPLLLGWVILKGLQAGFFDATFALSLFAIASILVFVLLIWYSAVGVERLSRQRDKYQAALNANEQKLRSFVEANVIGILFGDIYGNVRNANDEYLRMIGYSRQDLEAGRIRWLDITPSEYRQLDKEHIAEARKDGACKPYEKEYIRKDGTRIPVLVGYTLVGEQREESVAFILDLSQSKQVEVALQQSEERFRLAADNIPDVFSIYDAQRRLQFVNSQGLRVTGKTNAEILGKTDEEIFPHAVTSTYLDSLIAAQKTGIAQTTQATITFANYGTFVTLIKYIPIFNRSGELHQILAFNNDITASKQAEDTLRNQQQWLEYLLNLMPSPLLLIEPETAKVIFANHAADELAGGEFPKGKSAEEYHTVYFCTDADGKPIPNEKMPGVRVARGERLESCEMDWHTPGGIRSLLIFADTLPAMYGHAATCVLMFQDIKNIKHVEKALSLGYKRLQLLFDTASDLLSSQKPIALLDSVFRNLSEQIGLDCYFNYLADETQQVLHLASYKGVDEEFANQVMILNFQQGVCGKAATERHLIALEDVQKLTTPETDRIRSLGITAFASYPLIAGGKLFGTLGFGSFTRSHFSQNEIGMMQAVCDQIAIAIERSRLIGSLQQQTEQLREANRMKDEFLAVLSHELRSPLNAILGWAQLLRTRPNLDEAKKFQALETIERNSRAQKQLIEDLLDISRIVRGKLSLNVTSCNLVPIVEAAIDTVRIAAEAKDIEILFSIRDVDWEASQKVVSHSKEIHRQTEGQNQPRQSPIFYPRLFVTGDAERLQQVIWNLLANAIKFTNPGGKVEIKVSVETNPENLFIQVCDNGMGIKPEFIPYVFDRFRQEDSSTTRNHGGLGLGLAIARHLVELHGGTISVESPGVGKGSTFTVKLPLLYRKEKYSPIFPSPLPPSPSAFPSLAGVHVLIVDDEADTRDFLITVLQQSQAQVQAVSSVTEALEYISQSKPDVLVSDIGMPGEDGYSLIRKIRRRNPEEGGNIPAAALTAYARTEDRMRAIQEGFQLYLPKPVEAGELITVVASLAGRGIVRS
jgi:PAS domain S-box-containing protein